MNKVAKEHLRQACVTASTAKLRRELEEKRGPHHTAVRQLVYSSLVKRRHATGSK